MSSRLAFGAGPTGATSTARHGATQKDTAIMDTQKKATDNTYNEWAALEHDKAMERTEATLNTLGLALATLATLAAAIGAGGDSEDDRLLEVSGEDLEGSSAEAIARRSNVAQVVTASAQIANAMAGVRAVRSSAEEVYCALRADARHMARLAATDAAEKARAEVKP